MMVSWVSLIFDCGVDRRVASILHRPLTSTLLVTAALACLACTRLSTTASAADTNLTWTESDVNQMWAGYTNDFYTLAASGHHIFGVTAGSSTITGFWEEAEEIEMAEDGYYWAKTYGVGSASVITNMVNDICGGFV